MIIAGFDIEHRTKKIHKVGKLIINPFRDRYEHDSGMTGGLGVASYDLHISKDLSISSHKFSLASVEEYIEMPNDWAAEVKDKSSWARVGIALQNTFVDPGFRGHLTIEITNHSENRQEIEAGTPICQLVFYQMSRMTEGYQGAYQDHPPVPISSKEELL